MTCPEIGHGFCSVKSTQCFASAACPLLPTIGSWFWGLRRVPKPRQFRGGLLPHERGSFKTRMPQSRLVFLRWTGSCILPGLSDCPLSLRQHGDPSCGPWNVKQSCLWNRPSRPIGLWDVKDPTLSIQSVHRWHRPRSTPQKHYFSASGTHFCYKLNKLQGLVLPGGLRISKKNYSPRRTSNLRHPSEIHILNCTQKPLLQ
jgi:hypothetical protein